VGCAPGRPMSPSWAPPTSRLSRAWTQFVPLSGTNCVRGVRGWRPRRSRGRAGRWRLAVPVRSL